MDLLNTLDIKQLIILEDLSNGNNVFMSGPFNWKILLN